MMGDDAERWTASELRTLQRRGWRLVNHVMWQRHDVDHVLVGPGGVFVVETKWSSRSWGLTGEDDRLEAAVERARSNARRVQLWLRGEGVTAVHPVVMIWGAGTSDVPPERAVQATGDAVVVMGPRAALWRSSLPDGVLTAAQVDAVWRVLERYVARRDSREDQTAPIPRSVSGFVLLGAWSCVAAFAGLLVSLELVRLPGPAWSTLLVLAGAVVASVALVRGTGRARSVTLSWLTGVASGAAIIFVLVIAHAVV